MAGGLTVAERATKTVERLCPAEDVELVLEMLGLLVPEPVVTPELVKTGRASYEYDFQHGRPSGYRMHKRHHEDPCPECREAIRAYSEKRRRAAGSQPRALKPIKHGRASGARAHYKRHEKPCPECREAQRVYGAERYAVERATRLAQRAIPEQQAA